VYSSSSAQPPLPFLPRISRLDYEELYFKKIKITTPLNFSDKDKQAPKKAAVKQPGYTIAEGEIICFHSGNVVACAYSELSPHQKRFAVRMNEIFNYGDEGTLNLISNDSTVAAQINNICGDVKLTKEAENATVVSLRNYVDLPKLIEAVKFCPFGALPSTALQDIGFNERIEICSNYRLDSEEIESSQDASNYSQNTVDDDYASAR
jgi:hypothetical protein